MCWTCLTRPEVVVVVVVVVADGRATQRRRVSNHEEDRTDAGADVDRDDDEDEDEEDMIVSESMAVLLERIAGDARERMTYLGQTLIRDEVLRYLPRIP